MVTLFDNSENIPSWYQYRLAAPDPLARDTLPQGKRSDVERITWGADPVVIFLENPKNHQKLKCFVWSENWTGWTLDEYNSPRGVVCDENNLKFPIFLLKNKSRRILEIRNLKIRKFPKFEIFKIFENFKIRDF